MTFNQIKYFVTVAECLSFTEAAKCLFITQPALSRQISAMEQELGTKLFVRDKKRLKLTPGGSVLYNRLLHLLTDYEEAVEEARHANSGYEGNLHIGFLDIYDISGLFDDVIREFREAYENIEMSLERFSLKELPERLYARDLDLILTYGFSLYDKPDLMTVNIQKFDSCIMLNRNHPLAAPETISLADLKEERFIQLGPKQVRKAIGISPIYACDVDCTRISFRWRRWRTSCCGFRLEMVLRLLQTAVSKSRIPM